MIPQYNIRGQDEFDDLVVICDRNFFRLGGTWAEYVADFESKCSARIPTISRRDARLYDCAVDHAVYISGGRGFGVDALAITI